MSKHKKKKPNVVEGLQELAKAHYTPIGKGVKVTGVNLGKILHLLSLDAEDIGQVTNVGIRFAADGQLESLVVQQDAGMVVLNRGDWVIKDKQGLWAERGDVVAAELVVRP